MSANTPEEEGRSQTSKPRPYALLLNAALILCACGILLIALAKHLEPDPIDLERLMRVARDLDSRDLLEPLVSYIWPSKPETPTPDQDKPAASQKLDNAAKPIDPAPVPGKSHTATLRQIIKALEEEHEKFRTESKRSNLLWGLGVGFLLGGVSCFTRLLLTTASRGEVLFGKSAAHKSEETINGIVRTLLTRAEDLRIEARVLITFVFLLALGGVIFFHFSGDLSYEERASRRGVLGTASSLNLDLGKGAHETVADIYQDAVKEATFAESDAAKTAIFQLAANHVNSIVELSKAKLPSAETTISLNRNILISSIVARVGIVVVIGYLIRILLSSYRYNLRLATFYSSRAYSLMLIPPSQYPKSLAGCVSVLGSDQVEFERVEEINLAGVTEKINAVSEVKL